MSIGSWNGRYGEEQLRHETSVLPTTHQQRITKPHSTIGPLFA
jgi:hypothetical protein